MATRNCSKSKALKASLFVVTPLFLLLLAAPYAASRDSGGTQDRPQKPLDPAAWGGNHVGKPMPEYVHGDECLFCHRSDIGGGWQKNAHATTVRQLEDAPELRELLKSQPGLAKLAPEVEYFL